MADKGHTVLSAALTPKPLPQMGFAEFSRGSGHFGRSPFSAWFKKGSGTVAGTAGHRPKVGQVLRTTVPDPFLNHAPFSIAAKRL
jgi:hypothetical protein